MTTQEVLESRIKHLEAELAEAKAEWARLRVTSPPKTLGDLYGFLAHAGDFSENEMDAALYRADEALVKKLLGRTEALLPRLYDELAAWWPLLSTPADYAEEAAFFRETLRTAGAEPPHTLLELGSGGGNNASHLKAHFQMTLVDRAPGMLAVSRQLNPECEHVEGDMRTVRLGRRFDAVFVHDAIMYLTTAQDLRQAMETAFVHCRPGGAALFVPDCIRETFAPGTRHGGHNGADRALRYLEWTWDPDPTDTTFLVDYAYLLRDVEGTVRVEHDRHVNGLFPRAVWLRLLREVGFESRTVSDPYGRILCVAFRPSDSHPRESRQ